MIDLYFNGEYKCSGENRTEAKKAFKKMYPNLWKHELRQALITFKPEKTQATKK